MTQPLPQELGESPTVEVRVYRHGELTHRQLCESVEEAAAVVDAWSELDGVECEVDDLSVRHRPDEILEPSLSEPLVEEYAREEP